MSKPIDAATLAEVRRLWNRGVLAGTIGERFGLTAAEVREARDPRRVALERREAKLSARLGKAKEASRRAKADARRDEEIRRLWTEGTTGRALAARFGMVPSKVSGIVADLPRPVRYADPAAIVKVPPIRRPAHEPVGPPAPADMLRAERTVRGSEHGRAVLDEARVIELRRLRSEGWSTGRLAGRYGVARNTVCYAISGRTWRHVPGALFEIGGES